VIGVFVSKEQPLPAILRNLQHIVDYQPFFRGFFAFLHLFPINMRIFAQKRGTFGLFVCLIITEEQLSGRSLGFV